MYIYSVFTWFKKNKKTYKIKRIKNVVLSSILTFPLKLFSIYYGGTANVLIWLRKSIKLYKRRRGRKETGPHVVHAA